MDSPVRHQAAGIVPEPPESEVETIRVEWTQGSRPKPHVIVNPVGNGLIRLHWDGGAPALIGEDTDGADLAELAAVDKGHGILPMGIAALPLAHLDDSVVLLRGPDHDVALLDAVAQWFLAIYVLSGLAGSHQLEAMPVIWSADYDHIYVFVVDEFPPILIEMLDLLALDLLHVGGTLLENPIINIAKRYAIHVRITEECVQVAEPLAPAADQADVDLVIRSHRLGRHSDHKGTHSKPGAKYGALLQKLSPCHDMMCY